MTVAIVVMGVSGSGKSTIVQTHLPTVITKLYNQQQIYCSTIEGDDYHPPENIQKMRSGRPLEDTDRWPWLNSICDAAISSSTTSIETEDSTAALRITLISCSCLKRSYRDLLRARLTNTHLFSQLRFLYLHYSHSDENAKRILCSRLHSRSNHFMPISLLESQFASLEDPRQESDVYTIDCMNGEDAVLSKLHQFISGIISNEELK